MIPHKTASAFFLTVLAPLAAAVTSSPALQEAFADAIASLQENMFYEEADDDGVWSYQIYRCDCRHGSCAFLGEFEPALFEGSSLSR